jgi:hypothetical protein
LIPALLQNENTDTPFHEDGRFYLVPVTSNESRYSMKRLSEVGKHKTSKHRLQSLLDEFMAIGQTDTTYSVIPFGTGGDNFKNNQDKAKRQEPNR